MSRSAPRSLADALRAFDDARLGALLRSRPDLLHPVPSDITALATRATTGPSVARALDALDALDLTVLALGIREGSTDAVSAARLTEATIETLEDPHARDAVLASISRLVDRALLWGDATALRVVHPVRDALGGAEPSCALSKANWPPPVPAGDPPQRDPAEQAGIHALDALAMVDALIELWGVEPAPLLRSGGLSVRELARAMRQLGEDAGSTALWIELAAAAGLVHDDGEDPPRLMPTTEVDSWLTQEPARRWVRLARAWLTLPTLPSTATERTNVLARDDHRAVSLMRRQVLALLAEAEGSLDATTIQQLLDYRHPRRKSALREAVIAATLREGARLGVITAGALTPAGRALLELPAPRTVDPAQRAIAACLPPLIDRVIVQADMTIIAPGPVVPELAQLLRLVADVESRGHASVHRVSEASVRRAFDAGWDAALILRSLTQASSTPLPQAMEFLVHDVARRHGVVRVGTATSYVRCDAPETLSAILADRRLVGLGLAQIADSVLTSSAPTAELLEALRSAGYAPAAEAPDGRVVLRPRDEHRAPAPSKRSASVMTTPTDRLVDAAVRSLRAAERAGSARRGPVVTGPAGVSGLAGVRPASGAAAASALRSAVEASTAVWIAYADTDGTTTEQLVDPIRVGGGQLIAFDHRTESVRTFQVARIGGVAPVEG